MDYNILRPFPDMAASDPLAKLEVETASTTSVPLSFPYYYIEDGNNSFDTFNILNASASRSNVVPASPAVVGGLAVKKEADNKYIKEMPSDMFNQVPKRFSQFITEQQSTIPRPIDDLSSGTTSIGSDSDSPLRSKLTTKTSPNLVRSSHQSSRLTKEISNSMESQATIFSTRQDDTPTKNRTGSISSSLKRRRAIRFKQGGLIYRMKLRLKKWMKKLKKLKFRTPASSKRTGSITRRRKTLKRKFRLNPRNQNVQRLFISAPTNNPHLGNNRVMKVSTLDEDLKYEAGAPKENINFNAVTPLNHLSKYIDQQQHLYLDKQHEIEEIPVSEYSSIPPPPPKHQQTIVTDYSDLLNLWRKYLTHVVAKRIQLRQEIAMYQLLAIAMDKGQDSDTESISTVSDVTVTSSASSEIENYTDSKFNKLKNRQSMLGDMLDYDSDWLLDLDQEPTINKQYSVRRSLSSMSQNNSVASPIRRSQPHSNIHQLVSESEYSMY